MRDLRQCLRPELREKDQCPVIPWMHLGWLLGVRVFLIQPLFVLPTYWTHTGEAHWRELEGLARCSQQVEPPVRTHPDWQSQQLAMLCALSAGTLCSALRSKPHFSSVASNRLRRHWLLWNGRHQTRWLEVFPPCWMWTYEEELFHKVKCCFICCFCCSLSNHFLIFYLRHFLEVGCSWCLDPVFWGKSLAKAWGNSWARRGVIPRFSMYFGCGHWHSKYKLWGLEDTREFI